MNIFSNIINMYNEDPIKFLMIIAIIYLIFNSMNINENFKLSTVENDVNLTALSAISQIVPKFEKAFSIDNDGNITFKKDFKVIGKSEFDKDIRIKRRAKFSPANSTDDPTGTYALYGFNRDSGNKRGLEIANLITSRDTKVGNQKEGDLKGTPFSIRHDVNRNQENDLEVNGTVEYKHLTKTNELKKQNRQIVNGAQFNLYTPWFESNCSNDEYMCGVNARIEGDQGEDRDDTGMNGMKISCCKF